jgi:hypothetical protein
METDRDKKNITYKDIQRKERQNVWKQTETRETANMDTDRDKRDRTC